MPPAAAQDFEQQRHCIAQPAHVLATHMGINPLKISVDRIATIWALMLAVATSSIWWAAGSDGKMRVIA